MCNKGKNNADACAESVQRDLPRHKRPTTEAKETYYRGKRDLLQRQKRHTFHSFSGVDNVKVYFYYYFFVFDILFTASAAWTMSRNICSWTQMKEGTTTSCAMVLHEPVYM